MPCTLYKALFNLVLQSCYVNFYYLSYSQINPFSIIQLLMNRKSGTESIHSASLYVLENLFYFGIQCVVLHNNIMCPAFYDTCRRHECDFGIFLQFLNGQRSAVAHGMLHLAQCQIDIVL